ncbi:undecaprenyldiphospho-muramoylpentapeptide beta-N-acetylglucosaminyltransferase [Paenibacillus sp. IB182496]|uniref:UDP-N-acetylglucosamine--N-acetylmuramyl-(pentapeptide) pyrophosphoryl-undecaprenol N-acetylglucosamine transferase n=1 Tax=Paenibacillus sabuli TaxID=2772509 RepID=A0A927BVI8_9BACL|nr:undecaprenyldiphospho-muramoylpentapeptide beta-N-acetylglucosaminyltransferase [Paenibacillus sabuli]MBD2846289.1 undecaprenyldiphospho-muramoylpentapeptide beta-N-acetylglucosaminyltransferase [Paenibacillus sabuli]
MRIVLTGGGTGGHIYPAIAIGRQLQHDASAELLYIGTHRGLEARIVPEAGIAFEAIDITGFKRRLSLDNVKTVLRFLRGVRRAKALLRRFKPDAVVGTGGYVCGPVVYAASKLGIPTLIHEQNVDPGLTNRFLSRYADRIAVSFAESAPHFDSRKLVHTGNPCATEVLRADRAAGYASLGIAPGRPIVLVVGGSRGARAFNEALPGMLGQLDRLPAELVFVTGEAYYEHTKGRLAANAAPANLHVVPYVHNMPQVLAAATLVVCRAGASSLAELTALGVPSILIPSPNVTNNHQEPNARALADAGAAEMMLERELTGEALIGRIAAIVGDPQRLRRMGDAARALGMPEAGAQLSRELQALCAGR